jgi:ankyrin repeat protein
MKKIKSAIDIHNAVLYHQSRLLKKIIAAGVDLEARCNGIDIKKLIINGVDPILRILLESYSVKKDLIGATPLIIGADIGFIVGVNLLLENGARIDAADNTGDTPLIRAAYRGRNQILTELIRNGAMIDAVDKDGWTALMHSCAKGNFDATIILLENGSDPAVEGSDGTTPLMLAARYNYVDIVKELLGRRCDVNRVDVKGWSALMHASLYAVESAEALIKHGADPDIRSELGITSLMIASQYGCIPIVCMLMEVSANSDIRDIDGRTAIDHAELNSHHDIAETIREMSDK